MEHRIGYGDGGASNIAQPWAEKGILRWAVLAVLAAFGLVSTGVWRFAAAYRLSGDDFSVVWNSCAPYFDLSRWTAWFTEGYSGYFENYPGWPSVGSNLARPFVNLLFRAEGLLANVIGEPAFLLGGYLSLLATVLLVTVLLRNLGIASGPTSAILGAALGLSPIWHGALLWAGLATNACALAFSVGALVALNPAKGVPKGWRLGICVALQVLAIASHEAAAVLPIVCVGLLYAFAPVRPRLHQLVAFLVPVGYLFLQRALLPDFTAVYAFHSGIAATYARRFMMLVISPVPTGFALWLRTHHPVSLLQVTGFALGIVLNLVVIAIVVMGFRTYERVRSLGMIAALVFATAPGMLVTIEPRFRGLAICVAIIALCFFSARGPARRLRVVAITLLVLTHSVVFAAEMVRDQSRHVARVHMAGRFSDAARRDIARTSPRTVVLVNDQAGMYGARSMLRIASWPKRNVRPVVINSYSGSPAEDASVSVTADGPVMTVTTHMGTGQRVEFPGAVPDFAQPANGFEYSGIPPSADPADGAFTATGRITPGSTLVIGTDGRTGTPLDSKLF